MESEPTRVLLVDDDQGDFEMIRVMLSQAEHWSFKLDWVATFEEALDALEKEEHDVYILDYFLEDRNGLDLLKEAVRREVSAPILMLTGRGSPAIDQKAMDAGASDYLVKGQVEPATLERSIRHSMERARAAKELRDSEQRHRSMFDNLPVGLYRLAPDGVFMDANPALIRILGYPDRSALENDYSRGLFVAPEDRERFRNMLDRFGVVRGFESTIRRPDGVLVKVRNTSRAHRGADGEILYFEGTLEDVTAEEEARELQGSEARFRAMFSATGSGVALLDLDGIIREVNPAFAQLFGSNVRDMEGLGYVDLLDGTDQAPAGRELESLSSGERTHLEAERRFRGDGSRTFWARTTVVPIRGGGGDPQQFLILLEGVSEDSK